MELEYEKLKNVLYEYKEKDKENEQNKEDVKNLLNQIELYKEKLNEHNEENDNIINEYNSIKERYAILKVLLYYYIG